MKSTAPAINPSHGIAAIGTRERLPATQRDDETHMGDQVNLPARLIRGRGLSAFGPWLPPP